MALTLRRWIIIAITGFAILPVLLLRDFQQRPFERQSIRDRLANNAARARRHQVRLAEALSLIRLHDSVRAVLPRSGSGHTIVDPRIPERYRTQVAALLSDVARLRPEQPRGAVDVAVVLDSAQTFGGHLRNRTNVVLAVEYFAPSDASGRCVVIARINSTRAWNNNMSSLDARERFMGPCAFYEAFGSPGPRIKGWLDNRSWLVAQYGPHTAGGGGGWFRSYRGAPEDMRSWMSSSAFRCLVGNDSACVTAALVPSAYERRLVGLSGALLPPEPHREVNVPWWRWERAPGFGPRQASLLGDMSRALGDEKFLAFWRSSLEPMDAFREASGRDFPPWVREWMAGHYPPQETGPTTTRGSVAFALLILVAGVGLAILAATRRQAI